VAIGNLMGGRLPNPRADITGKPLVWHAGLKARLRHDAGCLKARLRHDAG
jgi:hypothetical protein